MGLGVQELEDLHLGPSSLTFWEENKPRQVSMDCDKSLKLRDADVWTWRRRVVLALGGLPRMQAEGFYSLAGLSGGLALEEPDVWRVVMNAIKSLPRVPDLTYLCTEAKASEGTRIRWAYHYALMDCWSLPLMHALRTLRRLESVSFFATLCSGRVTPTPSSL